MAVFTGGISFYEERTEKLHSHFKKYLNNGGNCVEK